MDMIDERIYWIILYLAASIIIIVAVIGLFRGLG
jgi:hypothetical protein